MNASAISLSSATKPAGNAAKPFQVNQASTSDSANPLGGFQLRQPDSKPGQPAGSGDVTAIGEQQTSSDDPLLNPFAPLSQLSEALPAGQQAGFNPAPLTDATASLSAVAAKFQTEANRLAGQPQAAGEPNTGLTPASSNKAATESVPASGALSLAAVKELFSAQGGQTSPAVNIDNPLASAASADARTTTLQSQPAVAGQPAPQWASLKLDGNPGQWGEQMLQVLHDRVTLQAQQKWQQASIRLDPPELGKLDLMVRVEGDKLSVQINSQVAATREALIQVSERLRAELQQQNFVHVEVNISSGDQHNQRDGYSGQASDGVIAAARESADSEQRSFNSEHWLSTQA